MQKLSPGDPNQRTTIYSKRRGGHKHTTSNNSLIRHNMDLDLMKIDSTPDSKLDETALMNNSTYNNQKHPH